MDELPYIVMRTPSYKKREDGSTGPREVDESWVTENLKTFTLFQHNGKSITCENLFNTLDYGDQPCTRAISALREIFSHDRGVITLQIREEPQNISSAYQVLDNAWNDKADKGNHFRRFYAVKVQKNDQMPYIDFGLRGLSAIVAPTMRPPMFTRPQSIYPDLVEFTTRIRVGVIQCAEYKQELIDQANSTVRLLKLIKIFSGGDKIYTGFLQLQLEVRLRLSAGDVIHINFQPKKPRLSDKQKCIVVEPFLSACSSKVTLNVYRPYKQLCQGVSLKEMKITWLFVKLDLSKYIYVPNYSNNNEVREAVAKANAIKVGLRVEISHAALKRIINSICNLQHSGCQQLNDLDGKQL